MRGNGGLASITDNTVQFKCFLQRAARVCLGSRRHTELEKRHGTTVQSRKFETSNVNIVFFNVKYSEMRVFWTVSAMDSS